MKRVWRTFASSKIEYENISPGPSAFAIYAMTPTRSWPDQEKRDNELYHLRYRRVNELRILTAKRERNVQKADVPPEAQIAHPPLRAVVFTTGTHSHAETVSKERTPAAISKWSCTPVVAESVRKLKNLSPPRGVQAL